MSTSPLTKVQESALCLEIDFQTAPAFVRPDRDDVLLDSILRPFRESARFYSVIPSCQTDLYVHPRCQNKLRDRVHRFLCGLDDVKHPLVRANLVLISSILVHERRDQHGVLFLLGRQGNWPLYLCPCSFRSLDQLFSGLINQSMIERLQSNSYSLLRHWSLPFAKIKNDWGCVPATGAHPQKSQGILQEEHPCVNAFLAIVCVTFLVFSLLSQG